MNARSLKSLKLALVAASAGAIATTAYAASPTSVSPVTVEAVQTLPAHDEQNAGIPAAAKKAGFAALFAGALALGLRLIGRRRLEAAAAVRPHLERVLKAPMKAARFVGSAVAAPFRWALAVGALTLFALTGINLLDIEWAAGLAVGAALSALVIAGLAQLGRRLASGELG